VTDVDRKKRGKKKRMSKKLYIVPLLKNDFNNKFFDEGEKAEELSGSRILNAKKARR